MVDQELEKRLFPLVVPNIWRTGGRAEAFIFVWEHRGNVAQIKARLREKIGFMADPDMLQGPMKPGASPRIYSEGYLAGLEDALKAILTFRSNGPRSEVPPELLARIVYREVLIAESKIAALRSVWECEGSLDCLQDWLHISEDSAPNDVAQQVQ